MPKPSSPFDDDIPVQAEVIQRERRPWWRWNILVLFGVLSALAEVALRLDRTPTE